MKKFLCCLVLVLGFATISGAAEPPYTEGTVWDVTLVRTEANRTDDYLRELSSYWKKLLDKAKEKGLVESYKLLLGSAANEDDFDLIIMTEYKNMAALDNTLGTWYKLTEELFSDSQTDEQYKEYEKVREILGSKLMREIYLK